MMTYENIGTQIISNTLLSIYLFYYFQISQISRNLQRYLHFSEDSAATALLFRFHTP